MPARRVTCPECDAPIRLSPDHPAGKKVRCPECDALVRPPGDDAPVGRSSRRDDPDDRPRRSGSRGKKKAQKSNAPVIIIASVVAAVLLAGGVVGAVLLTRDKKTEPVVADAGTKTKTPAAAPKAVGPPKPTGPVTVGLNIGN